MCIELLYNSKPLSFRLQRSILYEIQWKNQHWQVFVNACFFKKELDECKMNTEYVLFMHTIIKNTDGCILKMKWVSLMHISIF